MLADALAETGGELTREERRWADEVLGRPGRASDRVDAVSVGRLLAVSGTSDIVDAHVVICARRAAQRVLTSDPDALRALDPALQVVTI